MIPHLREWHPLYRHFIKAKNIREVLENIPNDQVDSFFSSSLYSMDLDSMAGKLKALKSIVEYKKISKKENFDAFPNKWITKEGEHFANWSDEYTNVKVLNALASYKTIQEIKNLGIEEFNHRLSPSQTERTIISASLDDRTELVKRILKQPGMLEALWNKPLKDLTSFFEEEREGLEGNAPLNEQMEPHSEQVSIHTTTLLHYLAGLGLNELIQQAVDMGIVPTLDVKGSRNGWTPLHYAVERGKTDTICKLMELGASKEVKDSRQGMTPLHQSVLNDKIDAMIKLIEGGANIKTSDTYGYTPLHSAAQCGKIDAVAKLIELGADKEARDNYGCTPLHSAAQNGQINTVTKLIELGANIEARNNGESTPLHNAAEQGKIDCMIKLLEAGADTEAQGSYYNGTPLLSAVQYDRIEFMIKLIEWGANIEAPCSYYNQTPLHVAARSGRMASMVKLIELGADKEAKDSSGYTPLQLAISYGKEDVATKLRELGAKE